MQSHRTLMHVFDKAPIVDKEAFVAPSASIIGNVQIGRGSSIWYGCVLRVLFMGYHHLRLYPELGQLGSERILLNVELPSITDGVSSLNTVMLHLILMKYRLSPCIEFEFGLQCKLSCRDVNTVTVGSGTNIQDNSLVHVAKSNLSGKVLPTIIGDNVTIGHSAVLHGCTVEDEAFIGMGATLLDGVVVEKHGMVAAGALVRQNTRISSGEVWGGNPAKFLRKLKNDEIDFISKSAENYSNLGQAHAAENAKPLNVIEFEKVLRKKYGGKDEEYDSMLGIVRETAPELKLPNNIQPEKETKPPSNGMLFVAVSAGIKPFL
ncbi:unnamed protein product [Thlaspi arvense]|uniref:Uncharacterized protein n=1 Tax=Thlaspi arvense TaxID=13288 RepID=A0AAU9RAN5_THLAR|nr:unnamed protein product [Thlaspi arvense]